MSLDEITDREDDDLGDYVPVAYARSADEADWYCQVLEDHDIPARADEDYAPPPPVAGQPVLPGLPVLVPESMLEEARGVIAEVEGMEVFDADADEEEEDQDELGPGYTAEATRDEEEL